MLNFCKYKLFIIIILSFFRTYRNRKYTYIYIFDIFIYRTYIDIWKYFEIQV